ncbi:hypothetical protein D3C72_1302170 [compost metagenome]
MGRQGAAWPERIGPRARRLDACVFRQAGRHSRKRLERRDRAGCGVGLGRAVPPLWQAALCAGGATGHRLRAQRVCRIAHHCQAVGAGPGQAGRSTRLPGMLCSRRQRAQGGRGVQERSACQNPGRDCRHHGRILLPRRACQKDGRAQPGQRRRDDRRRPGRAPLRLGGHGLPAVWRFGDPRNSSQRPGHRRADGAGHAR